MSNELNLSRQSKLIPADKLEKWNVHIFGVGSIGSHLTKVLAKSGFKDITVYDMDEVGKENISAQAFDFSHVGMQKVEAMKQIIKQSTGIDIITHDGEITEETPLSAEPNTIYVCVFDSLEARKIVFNKLKDMPIIFVDGRIGGYNLKHFLVDCSNPDEVATYEKTLNPEARSDLVCGEKACCPINTEISGKMAMNIIKYIAGLEYTKTHFENVLFPKSSLISTKARTEEL